MYRFWETSFLAFSDSETLINYHKGGLHKLAHKLATMNRTAKRRQQASGRGRDNASLQIRETTNEREPAPAPGASVPTNVSVDHQTRNDSVSDMGTASEIYLSQMRANEFS